MWGKMVYCAAAASQHTASHAARQKSLVTRSQYWPPTYARATANSVRPGGASFSLDSVGINRREVVDERVIQARSSGRPDPERCEGGR